MLKTEKPDVGQKHYEDQFNTIAGRLGDVDKNGDRIAADNAREIAKGLDETEKHANQPADPDIGVQDGEKNPASAASGSTFISNVTGKGGKKSRFQGWKPTSGVVGLLLAGAIGGSLFMIPGAIFTMLEGSLTSAESDGHRIDTVMRGSILGGLFSNRPHGTGKGLDKIGTLTDEGKAHMERNSFTFPDAERVGDGWRIKSMKFPGPKGETVRDGRMYQTISRYTTDGVRAAFKTSNSETRTFRDRVMDRILKKFNIDRSKIIEASRNKDKKEATKEMSKSFDENAKSGNTPEERAAKINADKEKTRGEVKGKVKLFGGAASAVSGSLALACTSYNAIRASVALVKAKWYYDIINVAFPFVQAGSQIRDQGNIEWEVVEYLADRLFWYNKDPSAPDYNQNAMDSYGMQQAIYGNFGALGKIAEKYTSGHIGLAVAGNNFVKGVKNTFGENNIANVCHANSFIQTLSLAMCAAGPIAFGACTAIMAGTLVFGDDVIAKVYDWLADDAFKLIAAANLNSSLRGKPLGDAIAAGIGLFLMYNSWGSGAQPALLGEKGVEQMKTFFAMTDFVDQNDQAIAKMQAKDNQFDMTNKYSFAGRLASTVNPYLTRDMTAYSRGANLLAMMGTSFGLISTSVAGAAGVDQPAMIGERKGLMESLSGDGCPDPDLKEVGLACRWHGGTVGVWSKNNLSRALTQMNSEADVTYQIAEELQQRRQIDTNLKYVEKSEFAKYREFCTDQREDPPGTTTKPVDEGSAEDQRWYTMAKCGDEDQPCGETDAEGDGKTPCLDNYRYFWDWCERQWPNLNFTPSCYDDTKEAPAQSNDIKQCGQGWTYPTDKNATTLTSPFGPRSGGMHNGVDLAGPEGTPIYAACDGVVAEAGTATGFGHWIIIDHDVNGKKVSTVYGHMYANGVLVKKGDTVKSGDKIGLIGCDGGPENCSGPHLHFEIWEGGRLTGGTPVDPTPQLGNGAPST